MSRRVPEPPPSPEPEPWTIELEPVDGMLPFGRWRITLHRDCIRYGGGDGWGWLAWTLKGARRRGNRILKRKNRADERMRARRIAAGLDPTGRRLPYRGAGS